ncbi:hypothetical protein J8273_1141 [Carpediemonas membranifera]|uniref:Tyrosine-protein kinase ephrin type A/B receptor-like domain-containing protein n=1 Tax=Carpediemonas membranifera TaxID=201153 RepID=A0A8J6B2X8_9EUKA|nr:hypothetical protein J8273_1141 [Carpediemonas membranifera]|eukprot:KAG9397230.1 hypothetical protein J8273_1141 [Carpediemonas membranifera]
MTFSTILPGDSTLYSGFTSHAGSNLAFLADWNDTAIHLSGYDTIDTAWTQSAERVLLLTDLFDECSADSDCVLSSIIVSSSDHWLVVAGKVTNSDTAATIVVVIDLSQYDTTTHTWAGQQLPIDEAYYTTSHTNDPSSIAVSDDTVLIGYNAKKVTVLALTYANASWSDYTVANGSGFSVVHCRALAIFGDLFVLVTNSAVATYRLPITASLTSATDALMSEAITTASETIIIGTDISVAVTSSMIYLGDALYMDDNDDTVGTVYAFTLDESTGLFNSETVHQFLATDHSDSTSVGFGTTVAASDQYLLIGDPLYNDSEGTVFAYTVNETTPSWTATTLPGVMTVPSGETQIGATLELSATSMNVASLNASHALFFGSCETGHFFSGTTCYPCPPGTYQPLPGQVFCHSCSSGQYQSAYGQSSCIDAVAGTFVADFNHTTSTPCSTGFNSEDSASTCYNSTSMTYYEYSSGSEVGTSVSMDSSLIVTTGSTLSATAYGLDLSLSSSTSFSNPGTGLVADATNFYVIEGGNVHVYPKNSVDPTTPTDTFAVHSSTNPYAIAANDSMVAAQVKSSFSVDLVVWAYSDVWSEIMTPVSGISGIGPYGLAFVTIDDVSFIVASGSITWDIIDTSTGGYEWFKVSSTLPASSMIAGFDRFVTIVSGEIITVLEATATSLTVSSTMTVAGSSFDSVKVSGDLLILGDTTNQAVAVYQHRGGGEFTLFALIPFAESTDQISFGAAADLIDTSAHHFIMAIGAPAFGTDDGAVYSAAFLCAIDEVNSDSGCVPCPANTRRVNSLADACTMSSSPCQPGQYLDGDYCTDASPGYYVAVTDYNQQTQCTEAGYFSFGGIGAIECFPAPAGYVSTDDHTGIVACSTGQYQDETGQTSCKTVDAGYYPTTDRASQTLCDSGYYSLGGTDDCTACPTDWIALDNRRGCYQIPESALAAHSDGVWTVTPVSTLDGQSATVTAINDTSACQVSSGDIQCSAFYGYVAVEATLNDETITGTIALSALSIDDSKVSIPNEINFISTGTRTFSLANYTTSPLSSGALTFDLDTPVAWASVSGTTLTLNPGDEDTAGTYAMTLTVNNTCGYTVTKTIEANFFDVSPTSTSTKVALAVPAISGTTVTSIVASGIGGVTVVNATSGETVFVPISTSIEHGAHTMTITLSDGTSNTVSVTMESVTNSEGRPAAVSIGSSTGTARLVAESYACPQSMEASFFGSVSITGAEVSGNTLYCTAEVTITAAAVSQLDFQPVVGGQAVSGTLTNTPSTVCVAVAQTPTESTAAFTDTGDFQLRLNGVNLTTFESDGALCGNASIASADTAASVEVASDAALVVELLYADAVVFTDTLTLDEFVDKFTMSDFLFTSALCLLAFCIACSITVLLIVACIGTVMFKKGHLRIHLPRSNNV